MKGEWRVTSCRFNGKVRYSVYRLLDTQEVDYVSTREYGECYKSMSEAQTMADKLNAAEKEEETK